MLTHLDRMVDAFQDELKKIAAQPPPRVGGLRKALPVMAAGAVGWEGLRRANEDRKMGKQIRQQQNPGIFG